MEKLRTFWRNLNVEEKLLALYILAFINTRTFVFTLRTKKILYVDIIFLLLFAVFIWKAFKNKRNLPAMHLKKPVVVMSVLFMVSFLNSVNLADSILELMGLVYCIALFIMVSYIITTSKKLNVFLYLWVFMACFISLMGLIVFFAAMVNKDLLNSHLLYYTTIESMVHHFPRISSTFYSPNMLCTYLHVSLVFSFILLLSETSRKRKYFIIACMSILFVAAFLTGSRRFMGLLLSIFLISLWYGRGRIFSIVKHASFYGVVLFILITILTTIWVIAPVEIIKDQKAKTVGLRIHDSYSLHFLQYVTSINIFKKHPFIGVGFGTYNRHFKENVDWNWVESSFGFEAYPEYVRFVKNRTLNFDPHSVFLGALAETGILGFVGLCYLFVSYAVLLFKGFKKRYENKLAGIISGCILAGFAGFLLNGLTIDILSMRHFWFMLAIGLYHTKNTFSADNRQKGA